MSLSHGLLGYADLMRTLVSDENFMSIQLSTSIAVHEPHQHLFRLSQKTNKYHSIMALTKQTTTFVWVLKPASAPARVPAPAPAPAAASSPTADPALANGGGDSATSDDENEEDDEDTNGEHGGSGGQDEDNGKPLDDAPALDNKKKVIGDAPDALATVPESDSDTAFALATDPKADDHVSALDNKEKINDDSPDDLARPSAVSIAKVPSEAGPLGDNEKIDDGLLLITRGNLPPLLWLQR